jgi:aminoglycoside 3-N-acetyltransferase I
MWLGSLCEARPGKANGQKPPSPVFHTLPGHPEFIGLTYQAIFGGEPVSNLLTIRVLGPDDVEQMEAILTVFGEEFNDAKTYNDSRPGRPYLTRLLGSNYFIALSALKNRSVVGGLAAYELQKFEQERSEIYIYDLAVASAHRREGIATALVKELERIAASRAAHVIFVQADIVDTAAIALYSKLGTCETVLHFDMTVPSSTRLV